MLVPSGGFLKRIFSSKQTTAKPRTAGNVLKSGNPVKTSGGIFGRKKVASTPTTSSRLEGRVRSDKRSV